MPQFGTVQEAMGFVQSQTKAINTTVYQAEYPEVAYEAIVPLETSAPEWSTGMITYITDYAGASQWIAGKSKDMPLAEVVRGDSDISYSLAGIGYGYDLEEINHAAMLGIPLTSQKGEAARLAARQQAYQLALYGDASKGKEGLCNSALVTSGLVALNGGATSRLWADKTDDEILQDVDALLTGIVTASLTVEMPNRLLLSVERMSYLNQRTKSGTDRTLLSFILANNIYTLTTGQPLEIRALRGLSTLGAGNTQRMVAYNANLRNVAFHEPMSHRFLPIWQDGPMSFIVPGIMRLGGTEIRRPGSMRYADGF